MIAKFLLYTIALALGGWLLPGIKVDSALTLVTAAAVLGLLNTFLRPIFTFLSLPFVVLSGGLFLFVINAAMILLADSLIDGFHVEGFLPALLLSLITFVVWLLTPSGK